MVLDGDVGHTGDSPKKKKQKIGKIDSSSGNNRSEFEEITSKPAGSSKYGHSVHRTSENVKMMNKFILNSVDLSKSAKELSSSPRYGSTKEDEERDADIQPVRRHSSREDKFSNSSRYTDHRRMIQNKREVREKQKEESESEQNAAPKELPNFKPSGLLSKHARTTSEGVVLKFVTPKEARIPLLKWRLYPFKDNKPLDYYKLYLKSVYLFGRDRSVADVPLDHQSCSTQHAVIVHRQVLKRDPVTQTEQYQVHPYIIDLGSTNGTYLNDAKIDDMRYYQLLEKDCLRFGASSREYVLINDQTVK